MSIELWVAVASLAIGSVSLAITITIFIVKISNKIEKIYNSHNGIQEFMNYMQSYSKEIKKDIDKFKEDNKIQLNMCNTHSTNMLGLHSELKLQNNTQGFMKELFEDIKRIQLVTIDAIGKLNETLIEIKAVINGLKR